MTKTADHPIKKFSQEEKVAYLSVVASMANADGQVTDEEISHLRKACKNVELDPTGIGAVIAAAEDPSQAEIKKYMESLSSSELRFTLLTDIFYLAYADNKLTDDELENIGKIGSSLKIKVDQIAALRKYVEAVRKAENAGSATDELKKLGGDVTATLAATGVPLAAVAISGSIFGLSAAGITSGLAALGILGGMASGIGTVAALGAGTYIGVRWLYKKVAKA